jgi:hypothetical protein
LAVRSVLVRVDAAAEFGVCVPVALSRVFGVPSSLDGSGVVGLLLNWLLKFGRSKDVKDGEGGRGVGGRP